MFSGRWLIPAMLLSFLAVSSASRGEDKVFVLVMPDDVKAKFAKLDRDGDRLLTREEFRTSASQDKEPVTKREFQLFDGDNDGKLTPDETANNSSSSRGVTEPRIGTTP